MALPQVSQQEGGASGRWRGAHVYALSLALAGIAALAPAQSSGGDHSGYGSAYGRVYGSFQSLYMPGGDRITGGGQTYGNGGVGAGTTVQFGAGSGIRRGYADTRQMLELEAAGHPMGI